MIGTAQKPLEKMVGALKGCRKVGLAGAVWPGGGRRPAPLHWVGHESIGGRDYPALKRSNNCKKLLFMDWHYICL